MRGLLPSTSGVVCSLINLWGLLNGRWPVRIKINVNSKACISSRNILKHQTSFKTQFTPINIINHALV